jgi:Flp pilus assembly pilin Flp
MRHRHRLGRLAAALRSTRPAEDESGQGLAEYALILTLVAAVCVGALQAFGGAISGQIASVAGNF